MNNSFTSNSSKDKILNFSRVSLISILAVFTLSMVTLMELGKHRYNINIDGDVSSIYTFLDGRDRLLGLLGYSDNYALINDDVISTDETYLQLKEKLNISVSVDNETIFIRETEATVKDILQYLSIELGEYDEVNFELDSVIDSDSRIVIDRIEKVIKEETMSVPFDTKKIKNPNVQKNKTKVITDGVAGKGKNIIEVVYKNGEEVDRSIISTHVIEQPVAKVIEYGTKTMSSNTLYENTRELASRGLDGIRYSKVLDVVATAYTTENKSWKRTATGTIARVGAIGVDPKVIPYGTRLYITADDGKSWVYGYAVAEDTGNISGNRIDVFFNTKDECINFGVRKAKVYILG